MALQGYFGYDFVKKLVSYVLPIDEDGQLISKGGERPDVEIRESLKPIVLSKEEIDFIVEHIRKTVNASVYLSKEESNLEGVNHRVRLLFFRKKDYKSLISNIDSIMLVEQLTRRFTFGDNFCPKIAALFPSFQCVVEEPMYYYIIIAPPGRPLDKIFEIGRQFNYVHHNEDRSTSGLSVGPKSDTEDNLMKGVYDKITSIRIAMKSSVDMLAILDHLGIMPSLGLYPGNILFDEVSGCCSIAEYSGTRISGPKTRVNISELGPITDFDFERFVNYVNRQHPSSAILKSVHIIPYTIVSWLYDRYVYLRGDVAGLSRAGMWPLIEKFPAVMLNQILLFDNPGTHPEFKLISTDEYRKDLMDNTFTKRTTLMVHMMLDGRKIDWNDHIIYSVPRDVDDNMVMEYIKAGKEFSDERIKKVKEVISESLQPVALEYSTHI